MHFVLRLSLRLCICALSDWLAIDFWLLVVIKTLLYYNAASIVVQLSCELAVNHVKCIVLDI